MKSPIELMLDNVNWQPIDRNATFNADSDLPVATHEGILNVGNLSLRVYQLSNGQRVIRIDKFFGGES